jgi:hypothetical protein
MSQKMISRRDALKIALAAGGGITAAAFLPQKWTNPVVKSGVLPVHAQTSGGFMSADDNGSTYIEDTLTILLATAFVGSDPTTPIPGVTVTLTWSFTSPQTIPTMVTPISPATYPQTAVTDAAGIAHFGDLSFNATGAGTLILTFTSAYGTVTLSYPFDQTPN